jgi:hypothetical protein
MSLKIDVYLCGNNQIMKITLRIDFQIKMITDC